jgi:Fe(II)/alpha-ketoglutarate-dependent arginine beta-hydroxylase
MLCLRNPDLVETTMAYLDGVNLDEQQVEILFEPRFTIRPDESHLEKNKARSNSRPDGEQELLKAAYQNINRMQNSPDKLSVLFGDRKAPYVRIDPYFMDQLEDDEEAQRALDALVKNIDQQLTGVVLQPGDFIFIDNYRVVHGRKPFKARYDGFDRWLKRINITRDLRKSRSARQSGTSRVIF